MAPAVTEADVQIAELRAEVRHLTAAVAELKAELKPMAVAFDQARGGWKIIGALAGLAGAVAGAIASAMIGFKT